MNTRSMILFIVIFLISILIILYIGWSILPIINNVGEINNLIDGVSPQFTTLFTTLGSIGGVIAIFKFILDYFDRAKIEFEDFYQQNNFYFIKVRKKRGKD